jgi:hyperosmotically inducible protein
MLLGPAGCSTSSKDERSAGRTLDDKHLTERIRESLDTDPVYKFNNVGIKAFAGEVQLSGFVNTDEQKRRATEIAQQTPGVTKVYDALAIKPSAPTPTGNTAPGAQSRIYSSPPQQQPAPPSQ